MFLQKLMDWREIQPAKLSQKSNGNARETAGSGDCHRCLSAIAIQIFIRTDFDIVLHAAYNLLKLNKAVRIENNPNYSVIIGVNLTREEAQQLQQCLGY